MYIKLNIECPDLESFCCIQKNRSTSKDRSKLEEDMKIKKGIYLLMKRELEGMKIFIFWTCTKICNFSSRCPKRVRKYRKSSLSDEDE